MKAITPVLSLILLIIIVIVVIGFSFGFFGNLMSSLTQASQEQVESQSEQMSVCFRIEAASGDTIYVRNCGSSPLSEFVVMSENEIINVTNSPTIEPGKVGEVKIDTNSISSGKHTFTISVGYIEDSITFTPSKTTTDNPPSIIFLSPEGTINITEKFNTSINVTFSCNASDDNGIKKMEIYTNISGSFTLLCNNSYNPPYLSQQNLTCKQNLEEGYYEWYCNATDNMTQTNESVHKIFEVNKPPIIYNLNNITGSSPGDFLVMWHTDEVSNCTFEYGKNENYGTISNTQGINHIISQHVDSETIYYFRINCTNTTDNDVGHYTGQVFSGPEPPILMNITSNAEKNSANITWTTNELADSLVIYSTNPSVPINSPNKSNSSYVTNHKIELTELSANTTYYYKVRSTDVYGAKNLSTIIYNFTTLP